MEDGPGKSRLMPGVGLNHVLPTRWCPRSLAFSWFISTLSLGLIRGLYRTSYWDYKPTYNWGGTTLYDDFVGLFGDEIFLLPKDHLKLSQVQ